MKHSLSIVCFFVLVSFLFMSTEAHSAFDSKGLVGLWLLDDAKGDVAKDTSPNKNDGKVDAGAKWDKGKFDGGLVTTAQNGINVSISDSLNTVIDAMSIGGWFRIDTASDTGLRRDTGYLLEDQSASEATPDAWAFGVWNEAATITLVWGQKKIKQGEWTHIAGTYDGKVLTLYVNGEIDSTANMTGKINRPGNALGLGKYSSETYIGGLDEIFLFSRALSQNEIKDLMKGYKSALTVVSNGDKLSTTWGQIKE